MEYCKRSPKGEIHSHPSLTQMNGKSKMQFLYSHLKKLEQQQRDRPNSCMRKQLTKIRAEINELETRTTVEQINRTRSWFFERINKIADHWQDLSKRIEKGPKLIKL